MQICHTKRNCNDYLASVHSVNIHYSIQQNSIWLSLHDIFRYVLTWCCYLLLYCGLCVHPVYLELLSSICPFLSPQCPTTTSTSPNSALAPWQSKLTSCKRRAPTRPPTTQTRWPPSLSSSSTIRPSLWPSRFVLSGYIWLCSSLSLCCFDQPLAFLRLSACV